MNTDLVKATVITDVIDAINAGKEIPNRVGDFNINYITTNKQRGYYKATPVKNTGWIEINTEWWSTTNNTEERIGKLYDKIKEIKGEVAIVMLPINNVLSVEYDLFVKGVDPKDVK